MTDSITSKLSKTFDYFRSLTPLSDDGKRVIQTIIDELKKDNDGSTIRYNLASNLSPDLLVSKDFAGNRVFYAKLVVALNLRGVNTPSTAGSREWNVRKFLNALYSPDARDRGFEVFKQNRLDLMKESMDGNNEDPIEREEEETDSLAGDINVDSNEDNAGGSSNGNATSNQNNQPSTNNANTGSSQNQIEFLSTGFHSMMELMKSMISQQHDFFASQNQNKKNQNHRQTETIDTDEDDFKPKYNHANAIKWMQTFYSKGKKFSGTFEENLDAHLEDFRVNCEGQYVPDDQKVRLLRLSLSDDALQFYREFIRGKGLDWSQTEKLFQNHFNAEAKQAEISNELAALRISHIRAASDTDRQALDKVISRISSLAPLAKKRDQDDEAKVTFLRNAVIGTDFASLAIGRIQKGHTYMDLINELKSAITDLQEIARSRNGNVQNQTTNNSWNTQTQDTLFNRYNFPNNSKNQTTVRKCFNCGKQGCRLMICKEPLDANRIARALEEFKKSKPKQWQSKKINLTQCEAQSGDEDDLIEICLAEKLLENPTHDPLGDATSPTDLSAQMDTAFSSIFHDIIGNSSPPENIDNTADQNIMTSRTSTHLSPKINFNNSISGLAQLSNNNNHMSTIRPLSLFSNFKNNNVNHLTSSNDDMQQSQHNDHCAGHTGQIFQIGFERDVETEGFWHGESSADTPRE